MGRSSSGAGHTHAGTTGASGRSTQLPTRTRGQSPEDPPNRAMTRYAVKLSRYACEFIVFAHPSDTGSHEEVVG